jgi:phage FluMu protein Com
MKGEVMEHNELRCPECSKLLMRDNAIKCQRCKTIVPVVYVRNEQPASMLAGIFKSLTRGK